MNTSSQFHRVGAALASPVRSRMLCVLMDGRAYTNKELASYAGVQPSSASEHLQHLEAAGLTRALRSGRCVYTRIASDAVAEMLEQLGTLVPADGPERAAPDDLRAARRCYGHLAGRLGVAITQALRADGRIVGDETWRLSDQGAAWARQLGLAPAPLKPCLDWTERKMHIAGPFAVSLMQWMEAERIVVPRATARGLDVAKPDALARIGVPHDAW